MAAVPPQVALWRTAVFQILVPMERVPPVGQSHPDSCTLSPRAHLVRYEAMPRSPEGSLVELGRKP